MTSSESIEELLNDTRSQFERFREHYTAGATPLLRGKVTQSGKGVNNELRDDAAMSVILNVGARYKMIADALVRRR